MVLLALPAHRSGRSSAWLERYVRDVEVARSNRVAPTFRLFGDLREKHPANGRQRPASLADAFHQSVEHQSQHGIAVASVVVALAAA